MSGFAAFRALVWRQTFDSLSNKTCKLFYQSALNQKIMPKTKTNTNTVAKTKTNFWQPFKQNIQIVLSVCPQLKDDAKDKHRDNGKDKDNGWQPLKQSMQIILLVCPQHISGKSVEPACLYFHRQFTFIGRNKMAHCSTVYFSSGTTCFFW